MKVRATNPAPEANPGGCATCGFGVPKPPEGGGTSAERRSWAMSQVGRPVVNPGHAPAAEPKGYGMASQFKPGKNVVAGVHPGRFGNPRLAWAARGTPPGGARGCGGDTPILCANGSCVASIVSCGDHYAVPSQPQSGAAFPTRRRDRRARTRGTDNPPTMLAAYPPTMLAACFNPTTGNLFSQSDSGLHGLAVSLIGYASIGQEQFARLTSNAWTGSALAPLCGATVPAARPHKRGAPTPYPPPVLTREVQRAAAAVVHPQVGARRAVRRSRAAQNPAPPLTTGRGGQLDYANQYAVFAPGVQPYGGYGGVGYAPSAPGVPVAYPVAPPGVYMQGQQCYSATDCAPGEYCHDGTCFPSPGVGRNVGVTQTTSIAGVPVGNPGRSWPLTFPTKGFRTPSRAANPGSPMTQMTQALAPPGFSVR